MTLVPQRHRRRAPIALSTLVTLSALFGASLATSSAPAETGASATESLPMVAVPVESVTLGSEPNTSELHVGGTVVDPGGDRALPGASTGDGTADPGDMTIDPSLVTEGGEAETIAPPEGTAPETLALPTGGDKSGVTSKSISVPSGSGTIQGMEESFSAQLSTGIATFSVPFALPSARGKAQPSLGLSYSSSGGFDVAGVGWSVGVPFIARQTDRGVPTYLNAAGFDPNQDRYVFNGGQELVPICVVASSGGALACAGAITGAGLAPDVPAPVPEGPLVPEDEVMPAWSAGWMYFRPRVEGSFLRFFFSPDKKTWRVQSKSGVTMELGVPLDETGYLLGLETNPDATNEIYRWHLVRQYDTYGDANPATGAPAPANLVAYRYEQDGGMAYVSDIFDTPPSGAVPSTDFDGWAHHTRLRYEDRTDPTSSYRSGWRIEQNRRLAGVDVTSQAFGAGAGSRRMVRRYHLEYEAGSHASLLASVQVEGRCGGGSETSGPAEAGGALPDTTGCPTLPKMAFGYSHVTPKKIDGTAGSADLPGYEGFDERLIQMTESPPHSVDEELTDLFDVNSDALPDVLVTAPGLFAGKHGAFFNSHGGVSNSFEKGSVSVQGVLGANANTITLKNLNLAVLDLDADATVNLLHMPKVKTYSIYTPVPGTTGVGAGTVNALDWVWAGRVVTTASEQSPKIDFGNDTLDTKVVDVNFDGLVDVVVSTGTEFQTFFSLGRLPNGDGQFGNGSFATASTSNLSNDPIRTCVPWSSTPVRFSDPDIHLADMNGDGITDIARIRRGQIQYWPGRGNGYWGTGERDDCPAGTFGQNRHIAMTDSPYYSDIQATTLRLDDVNGDGLTDIVQVRFTDVDIWLNVDGVSWTERHIIENTPASPSYADRVRLVDMNGSGTRDVLWGNGNAYKYIDLQGGTRPWMLTSVENGLGKTTAIDYSTSVAEMLAAEVPGGEAAWTKKMPTVAHVVKRVTESDGITVVGKPPGTYVTEYTYRDPVFEGRQREFRGFSSATVRRIGDANSPTDVTTSQFLLGECIDEVTRTPCKVEDRWEDNPREALKGLPFLTEKSDSANSTFLSTEHMGYRLRTLYTGLDGRLVRHAFESTMQRFLYDTGPFPSGAGPPSASVPATVELEDTPGAVTQDLAASVTLRATSGTARIDMSYRVDYFGNRTEAIAKGCTGESACSGASGGPDETITTTTLAARATPSEPTGWLWRTTRSFVTGSAPAHAAQPPRNETVIAYNANGDPTQTLAVLAGSVPLFRFHASGAGAAVAPPPATASQPSAMLPVSGQQYDALGNLTTEFAPNGRCRSITYDGAFAHLPVSESIATQGNTASGMGPGFSAANCGLAGSLSTSAAYDRGFELVTTATDMQGQATAVVYDGFGRLSALTRPSPASAGALSPAPSVTVEYFLPPDLGPGARHSIIHTRAQDGDAVTDAANYLESFTYVDGLGRTIVTLNEADGPAPPGVDLPSGTDGGAFIASGLVEYDNKSAVRRKYLEFFTDESPLAFDFSSARAVPYGRQRYDAFGRQLQTFDLDGTVTLQSRYHALSTDLHDAADLQPGPHQGTFASERKDGHGRTVEVTERFDDFGGMERRVVRTQYLHTNEPEVITRKNLDKPSEPEVVRWLRYDSLGRMVLNVEPNTTHPADFTTNHLDTATNFRAWRYAYNDFGDLAGTSEARGCGVNYQYDGAGRLRLEDYSPCETGHALYSPPILSPGQTRGIEVLYQYDTQATANGRPKPPAATLPLTDAFLRGRLVAVWDLGSATWTNYDGRGRVVGTAVRAVRPGAPALQLGQRYAARWFTRAFAYDAADREIAATTGAAVGQLLGLQVTRGGLTSRSLVTTHYSRRGTVQSAGGSYDAASAGPTQALVRSIVRDADGLLEELVYGDRASTTTAFQYDDRRRLRSVQTYRAPDWGSIATTPAPGPADDPTRQLLLQDEDFAYDVVNNPIEIRDWRNPEEWPDGAKPVTRKMQYDDLYRVTRLDYEYPSGDDAWTSPFDRENREATDPLLVADPRRSQPSPHVSFDKRVQTQTWEYDWLGNTRNTDDDAQGFYDRSLGAIANGGTPSAPGPYQLASASLPGPRGGGLTTAYDPAGNLVSLAVRRDGPCLPASVSATVTSICSQRFIYEWDEVGRLNRARRWDLASPGAATDPEPAGLPAADLRYAYDAGDQRVLKTAVDDAGVESHTVYLFESLELRRASFVGANYQRTRNTEVPYLFANGVRLARVLDDTRVTTPVLPGLPGAARRRHVMFELGDHLGSTSVVLDQATGELVERGTFMAYGGRESDYRPERWGGFREDYGFTGKEEDVEVGLAYFGKRFLSVGLGRWVSADPLGVHGLGADLNVYAYVSGAVLKNVDPTGLDPSSKAKIEQAISDQTGGSFGTNHAGTPQAASEGGGGICRENYTCGSGETPPTQSSQQGIVAAFNPEDIKTPNWVQSDTSDPIENLEAALSSPDPDVRLDAQLSSLGVASGVAPYVGDYAALWLSVVRFGVSPSTDKAIDVGLDTVGAALPVVPAIGSLRSADRVARTLPAVTFSASKYPELADNILNAQRAGHPSVLTHGGSSMTNRAAALDGVPNSRPLSRDEYPFASSMEGGAGSWVGHVPLSQQNAQGAILKNFFKQNNLKFGDQYQVIVDL